jgi:hypothetical protein
MLGLVVLIGGRLWRTHVAGLQAGQPAVTDLVRTKRLELVDEVGKVRAVLDMTENAPLGLHLHDAAGKTRVELGLAPDGTPSLKLRDAAGMARTALIVHFEGSPTMGLFDAAGKI